MIIKQQYYIVCERMASLDQDVRQCPRFETMEQANKVLGYDAMTDSIKTSDSFCNQYGHWVGIDLLKYVSSGEIRHYRLSRFKL